MCKRPLKGFKIGLTVNGKDKYKIVPYGTDHLEQRNGYWYNCNGTFVSPFADHVIRDYVEIPCGKCVDCKLNYSRQWADRCMLECKEYGENECWFLTITYDDDNIMDIGSDYFPGTLLKTDISSFLKSLRRHCEYHDISKKIRFYCCGEYGDNTHRPHYHMILYGVDLLKYGEMKYWMLSKTGFPTWRSDLLEKVWKKGMIVVSKVSWDTCAYTARYVLKKANGITQDHYIANGVQPEFVLMSRRPGIARTYFDDNYDRIYECDEIIFSSLDGGRKARPPRYFDKLYQDICPDKYEEIKEKRKKIAEEVKNLKIKHSGLRYEDILDIEDKIMINKAKLLKRC